MTNDRLWTAICKCRTCGREINRATHVPEHEKMRVGVSAALMAICDQKSHNTGSDYNLNFDLTWHEEEPNHE